MSELSTIRIYSRLLDTCEQARLWHVLRALDTEGTGRVYFGVSDMAALMSVSTQTIYRWLKAGLGVWWRSRRRIDGQVELYLSGITKVACALGVDGLGAIADVPLSELTRMGSKALATALEAEYRQRQAYWAAKKAKKGQAKKSVFDPHDAASSDSFPGAKGMAVVNDGFQIPGASVAGIAKTVGRSQSTIKRRLNNRWRIDRNIDPIQKKRVATELNDPELLFRLKESGIGFVVQENALGCTRVLKVLSSSASLRLLVLGCNVYAQDYELLSCRGTRGRVRRKLKNPGN
ncbi:hypothetical protein D0962_34545 [Leptolyngbyaceae cyanobacterium CCMR0082]|uniref:Uncharacterized protein n=1 Tax=Adonisia turfae CCMR0082 TaxID=2304604 RepID=A0A6M0SGW2_9CYAN|nr:hypothetical protein [Adonisia turfae]NEZ67818.1 hypothetical protein [Adonisia turfae CCMR0082]